MTYSKPLKITLSLLILFISVGLLSMGIQMFVMEKLNEESLHNFQEALIESRTIETSSFAQVVSNDLNAFRSQIYTLYSGTQFKRLKTTMAEGQITSRYLQDCAYMWSELKMRLFDNRLFSEISLYMMDSGRKVTTGSVVRNRKTESELLERITANSNGTAMIDGNLSLFRFLKLYDRSKARGKNGLHRSRSCHQRFGEPVSAAVPALDVSDASLMMLYADENGIRQLSSLKHFDHAEQLIVRAVLARRR